MDARSLVMGYAAARTVTDDPQTLNQSAILGAVMDGRPIVSFVVAQQYARSVTPAPAQTGSPAASTPALPPPATPTVVVPDLSTADDEKALQALLDPLHLKLVVKRQPGVGDDQAQPGDFISQSPAPGTAVPPNSAVTVVLSRGLAVTIPELKEHTSVTTVLEYLLRRRISVDAVPVYEAAGAYDPDDVVRLTPPSGSKVYDNVGAAGPTSSATSRHWSRLAPR